MCNYVNIVQPLYHSHVIILPVEIKTACFYCACVGIKRVHKQVKEKKLEFSALVARDCHKKYRNKWLT